MSLPRHSLSVTPDHSTINRRPECVDLAGLSAWTVQEAGDRLKNDQSSSWLERSSGQLVHAWAETLIGQAAWLSLQILIIWELQDIVIFFIQKYRRPQYTLQRILLTCLSFLCAYELIGYECPEYGMVWVANWVVRATTAVIHKCTVLFFLTLIHRTTNAYATADLMILTYIHFTKSRQRFACIVIGCESSFNLHHSMFVLKIFLISNKLQIFDFFGKLKCCSCYLWRQRAFPFFPQRIVDTRFH